VSKIENRITSVLVDTGAAISVAVSSSFMRKLSPFGYRTVEPKLKAIFFASAHPMSLSEAVELDVDVANGF
jgi:hypothetical protein